MKIDKYKRKKCLYKQYRNKLDFSFRYDFGKREKETCVKSREMNAMFGIPYNFQLSEKFSIQMINNTREKTRFSCTNCFRPIVV